jgi:hypothetical protein
MSVKAIARAAAASCVLAAALGAGAVASAQSYGYGPSDRYQSEQRSSRYHHSRYQSAEMNGPRREARGEQQGAGMQSASYAPPAFQISLSKVSDAKGALKGANVRDEDGTSIGSVRDVIASPDGQAQAVRINVGGVWGVNGKTVIVDAHEFRYESVRHELTADLSKGQIESLPGVKP